MFQEQYISQTQKIKELKNYYAKIVQNVKKFFYSLQQKTLTPIFKSLYQNFTQKIKYIYTTEEILSMLNQRIGKQFIRLFRLIKNKNVKKIGNNMIQFCCYGFYRNIWKKIAQRILNPQYFLYNIQVNERLVIYIKFNSWIQPKIMSDQICKFIKDQTQAYILVQIRVNFTDIVSQVIQLLFFRKYGNNAWKEISEELYFQNSVMKVYRSPKQCRQHWNCFLNPNLKKGPWSEQQDMKLLLKIKLSKGLKKWCNIKYFFEGRTQNALKNRYNLLIEKRKRFFPNLQQNQIIDEYLKRKDIKLTYQKKENNIRSQEFFEEQLYQNGKLKICNYQNIQKSSTNQIMNSFKSSFQISSEFLHELQNQQNNFFQYKNYIDLGSKVINEFIISKLKDKQQKINYYEIFLTKQTKFI